MGTSGGRILHSPRVPPPSLSVPPLHTCATPLSAHLYYLLFSSIRNSTPRRQTGPFRSLPAAAKLSACPRRAQHHGRTRIEAWPWSLGVCFLECRICPLLLKAEREWFGSVVLGFFFKKKAFFPVLYFLNYPVSLSVPHAHAFGPFKSKSVTLR